MTLDGSEVGPLTAQAGSEPRRRLFDGQKNGHGSKEAVAARVVLEVADLQRSENHRGAGLADDLVDLNGDRRGAWGQAQ